MPRLGVRRALLERGRRRLPLGSSRRDLDRNGHEPRLEIAHLALEAGEEAADAGELLLSGERSGPPGVVLFCRQEPLVGKAGGLGDEALGERHTLLLQRRLPVRVLDLTLQAGNSLLRLRRLCLEPGLLGLRPRL